MNIPKEKCEEMLDNEAKRVVESILHLVNSIKFDTSQLEEDEKQYAMFANKVTYILKQIINTEVKKEFNL